MALSEIIINDILRDQIHAVIGDATYLTLREYLLERRPLTSVTNSINYILGEHCKDDKLAYAQSLTQSACESQKTQDFNDAGNDVHENNNDLRLKANYLQELPQLEIKLGQLASRFTQQQHYIGQLNTQLNEQKAYLNQLNLSIERIHNERQQLNFRIQYRPQYQEVSIHSHYPQGTIHINGFHQYNSSQHHQVNIQTHYPQGTLHINGFHHYCDPQYQQMGIQTYYPQGSLSINAYPIQSYGYSMQDQHALDNLSQEENRLIAERQRVTGYISEKEAECTREERNLNQILSEKKQTQERRAELNRQIEVVLPNKEHQRQVRNQERLVRANARITEDPELNQLSHKERDALRQQILTKCKSLNGLRSQLLTEAVKANYVTYLEQLELSLQGPTGLKITYSERESLKLIISMMNKFNEMEAKEQEIIHSLNKEKGNLRNLQSKMSGSTETLQRYAVMTPRLRQINKDLVNENYQLKLRSDDVYADKATALFFAFFGGTGTVSSATLISGLMVHPAFFAISGALAFTAVISLLWAAIYQAQISSIENKIDQNKNTISQNERTILQQDKETKELNQKTIPGLRVNIEATQHSIEALENQLSELQNAKSQLATKAQNVKEVSKGNNSFFAAEANVEDDSLEFPMDDSLDEIDESLFHYNPLYVSRNGA